MMFSMLLGNRKCMFLALKSIYQNKPRIFSRYSLIEFLFDASKYFPQRVIFHFYDYFCHEPKLEYYLTLDNIIKILIWICAMLNWNHCSPNIKQKVIYRITDKMTVVEHEHNFLERKSILSFLDEVKSIS